jgi:hypothetical protein
VKEKREENRHKRTKKLERRFSPTASHCFSHTLNSLDDSTTRLSTLDLPYSVFEPLSLSA